MQLLVSWRSDYRPLPFPDPVQAERNPQPHLAPAGATVVEVCHWRA